MKPSYSLLDGVFPPPSSSGPATSPAPPSDRGIPHRRRKLWDLEKKHHCPVVGTCVSMEELLRLARRFGFDGGPQDDYDLHVEAVGLTMTRNPVSEALQKHLDRKYARHLRCFEQAKSDAEVLALWAEHHARGDVAGPMWAALSHKQGSEETRHKVYADIHMLSHQVGAGQAADARRLLHLEREQASLLAETARERREQTVTAMALRDRDRQLEKAMLQARDQANEISRLQAQLDDYESGAVVRDMGHRLMRLENTLTQLQALEQRHGEMKRELEKILAENTTLKRERDMLAAEQDVLERLLLIPAPESGECQGNCATCQPGMAKRCILCVGGRTALVSQYRALAERLGIRLLHHDGGQEEALSRLPDMIQGADAVLCPTDCVSHAAYYQLKRHCKRTGKPCLLFRGASVSGFALALAQFADSAEMPSGDDF